MSECRNIAGKASEFIEMLVSEMLEANVNDNAILLGTATTEGGQDIQIQLHVYADENKFMDEG
ncbi:MAG: hypothetical protein HRU20_25705 [Pseudomonadales bacterium]|nr:hypothetical protein [Pseudomonadales bacterium]